MKKLLGVLLLAVALPAAFSQTIDTQHGSWSLHRNVDLITDENRSLITGEVTDYPGYSRYAGLVIRCRDVSPVGVEIYFFADQYLGSRDTYSVVYRVDGRDPVTGTWYSSSSHESVFAPDRLAATIIGDMLDSQQLVFRVSSFAGPETYVQPISGFRGALTALGCYTGPL